MLTAVHFAHIAAQPAAEKAALIVAMTPAERAAYARYLDAIAFDYSDDVPADYVAPTAASVLAEAQAVLASPEAATAMAVEAAETFDADYDAWLDSLPGDQPTPEDFGVEAA
jgi:hypothetical protein